MIQAGYFLALGIACPLAGWIAYAAWRNRTVTGARALAGVALATGVWAGGALGLALSTDPAVEFRWLQFTYLGIVAAPITFVLFALDYTGHQQYLTSWTVGSLCTLGGTFLLLAWTNPFHQWYWAKVDPTATVPAGTTTTPALGFWGFVVFTYLLLLTGTLLLVRYALTAPHLYRSQSLVLLVGVGVPWIANIPHSLQWMTADYTPVALAVTSGAIWTAMFRYRLTNVGPIALRTVFESISTGVYVLDPEDQLVDVNAAGRALLDLPDDAIGTPIDALVPDEQFQEPLQTAPEQPKVIALDAEHLPAPEATGTCYYEVRTTPIDDDARQNGRIVVINDVTDQHRRQQQLERQNERLEEFTTVVSHDLRNPLNVATGNVTLAREEGGEDFLKRADRALSRMATLIDDLLALAHGGKTVQDPEPVDLRAVVNDAWQTVDTQDATLQIQLDTTLVADRSRLHQLIANLLRNAVEHGTGTVTITVGEQRRGFFVADNGPGIPSDERSSVFDTGYTTRDDGTGFGLDIVRTIAEAHGWDVDVTDSAAGGARFEITGVELVG